MELGVMDIITVNNNSLNKRNEAWTFFIDMNSFFATVEQQYNYWLRGKPIGVCVYTGKHGCIISPSIEAKLKGIKLGMRLSEAMNICPDLIPVETRPERYREVHKKFINVLKDYCDDVIPKSIDEAVMDLNNYSLYYKDQLKVAKQIKQDVRNKIGDWIKVSIGIAPNAFLAKLASGLQKPDGLVMINQENIDDVLSTVPLVKLPGIKEGIARKLIAAGIRNPVNLRHSSPWKLKSACGSIIGVYWWYRLNFSEVDQIDKRYKSMQAMRQISRKQRESIEIIEQLLITLCMTLERRMVKERVFCSEIIISLRYEEGYSWEEHIITLKPVQDGMEIMNLIKLRIGKYENVHKCEPLLNNNLISIGVTIGRLVQDDVVQYELFGKDVQKNYLRKIVYDIKDKYGNDIIMKAIELKDESVLKDVIGFGSIKDMHLRELD